MQADDGNDASPTNSQTSASGSQKSVACAGLISRDGPRRFLLFRADSAAMGEATSSWGGNVMSLLTGGEQAKCCSWV